MKNGDKFYAIGPEGIFLYPTPEEALEYGYDGISADRVESWPIKILVYERKTVYNEERVKYIAEDILERTIEKLDEDFGSEDGDGSPISLEMEIAARKFAEAILNDYVSWVCEPTGEVVSYDRDQFDFIFNAGKDKS